VVNERREMSGCANKMCAHVFALISRSFAVRRSNWRGCTERFVVAWGGTYLLMICSMMSPRSGVTIRKDDGAASPSSLAPQHAGLTGRVVLLELATAGDIRA